jgi:hypothetical protein
MLKHLDHEIQEKEYKNRPQSQSATQGCQSQEKGGTISGLVFGAWDLEFSSRCLGFGISCSIQFGLRAKPALGKILT